MTPSLRNAALWIAVYLLLVLAPVLVMLISLTVGAGFWWDFSMAIGFCAMAMMGVQFALTARFRRATAPFGIDVIYYFHRFAAVLALLMISCHALIVLIDARPVSFSDGNSQASGSTLGQTSFHVAMSRMTLSGSATVRRELRVLGVSMSPYIRVV